MSLSTGAIVAIDTAAWLTIQISAGYFVTRLSDEWLAQDRWLFRERGWERGGRFYRERLRVSRWKRWLPEGGTIFGGGFDKRSLASTTSEHLERYRRETRRAEVCHWLAIVPAPLFVLWNPLLLWFAMLAYAVIVNGPCIISQRYNRLRVSRVLAARANGWRASTAARSRKRRGTTGSNMP